ncbi:hypothetical protein [Limobrevibacterium gyesilva]|uniref:Uncharacterized protein n=1 Tax=Limobrevibacterium gyesilva TaxID=2991712 RepID=A0AA41YSQ9_9PROT|nr:hypothetical protein [Limobrevibacterium gyesilva]MCW3477643.1 hypothetical protein [Limobrevibacterium gyesilva]
MAQGTQTGGVADMLGRLKAVLPPRWFADETPVLDAVLGGFAASRAWLYSLLDAAKLQTRLATATDAFLDMIALDLFGRHLARRAGQGDAAFRARIQAEILRERGTRAGLVGVLTELTGRAPVVFEPARPADTGGWGVAAGYGAAGGWGSLVLPFQCFVTAYRPVGEGIAFVSGWGCSAGGYGGGAIEYASLAMAQVQMTDADIAAAIAGVMPVGAIAWTRISN